MKEGGKQPNLRDNYNNIEKRRRKEKRPLLILDTRRSANMGRSPSCDDSGLKKGPWTPDEDEKLINYVQKHGHSSWRALPKLAGTALCFYS